MWVRSVVTVPSPAGALAEALGRLSPDTLAALAQAASRDGCHLHAHLGRPVRRDEITTFHLRWWNDGNRSLTPAVNGELALRPLSAQVTELAITAQYQGQATLRELADSMFLRRLAESVVTAFLHSLVESLEPATGALASRKLERWSYRTSFFEPDREPDRKRSRNQGAIQPYSPPARRPSVSLASGNHCERVKRHERLKT